MFICHFHLRSALACCQISAKQLLHLTVDGISIYVDAKDTCNAFVLTCNETPANTCKRHGFQFRRKSIITTFSYFIVASRSPKKQYINTNCCIHGEKRRRRTTDSSSIHYRLTAVLLTIYYCFWHALLTNYCAYVWFIIKQF